MSSMKEGAKKRVNRRTRSKGNIKGKKKNNGCVSSHVRHIARNCRNSVLKFASSGRLGACWSLIE